ncbi:MAG TPA: hypothetical protein VFD59_07370 [Nocardioidaceae bacterium]|nr:hypothetical protein [Nocardioidaceae bacterium]
MPAVDGMPEGADAGRRLTQVQAIDQTWSYTLAEFLAKSFQDLVPQDVLERAAMQLGTASDLTELLDSVRDHG